MGVRVRQREKGGPWWVFITYRGQRKAKLIGDKQAAELVASKVRLRLAEGGPAFHEATGEAPGSGPTVREYAERWLATYARIHCRETTARRYEEVCRLHLYPAVGEKRVSDLTREDLKRLLAEKAEAGLAHSTLRNILAPIREMLNEAVEDGLIRGNPAGTLGRRFNKGQRRPPVQPPSPEDVARLLTQAQADDPRHYALLLTAARAGLRLGELIGLQWGDVDFAGRFLQVQRQVVRGNVVLPKSGKTRRVELTPQLAATLRELLHRRKAEALQKGWGEVPPWVFCSTAGTMLDDHNPRNRVLHRLCARAGLRQMGWHALRHYYASALIAAGADVLFIRDQLGHASAKMTLDVYGHLFKTANRGIADRLDQAETATACNLSATSGQNVVPAAGVKA